MKIQRILITFFAVLLSVSLAMAMDNEKKDIIDTAIDAGSFDTLITTLKAADLVSTLKEDGPFTLFAPTDRAFAKLPAGTLALLFKAENKGNLQSMLTAHIIPAQAMATDVVNWAEARTVNGSSLMVNANDGKVMVDGAQVIKTDIVCSNGVIHVIDTVIMPK